mmetsp:Transcript_102483/g.184838  ORF Transcript_102483/g.184838 Transcript_102483/m.184838 type:complete len:202 (+) Transcript_102483:575-1180(+)
MGHESPLDFCLRSVESGRSLRSCPSLGALQGWGARTTSRSGSARKSLARRPLGSMAQLPPREWQGSSRSSHQLGHHSLSSSLTWNQRFQRSGPTRDQRWCTGWGPYLVPLPASSQLSSPNKAGLVVGIRPQRLHRGPCKWLAARLQSPESQTRARTSGRCRSARHHPRERTQQCSASRTGRASCGSLGRRACGLAPLRCCA